MSVISNFPNFDNSDKLLDDQVAIVSLTLYKADWDESYSQSVDITPRSSEDQRLFNNLTLGGEFVCTVVPPNGAGSPQRAAWIKSDIILDDIAYPDCTFCCNSGVVPTTDLMCSLIFQRARVIKV